MQDRGLAAYIAELLGTLFLVFVVGTVVTLFVASSPDAQTGSDFAVVGLVLALMLFGLIMAFGAVSGGHFNPAITLAAAVQRKIDPGDPLDKDMYHLSAEEYENIRSAPSSLDEALDELENDHDFLLQGDVFTADVIHYWIKYKRENEIDAIRMRPHPYEFCMYFDI